jgi:hypothetical protein
MALLFFNFTFLIAEKYNTHLSAVLTNNTPTLNVICTKCTLGLTNQYIIYTTVLTIVTAVI